MKHIAKGSFKVNLQTLPFEEQEATSKLGRRSIDKEISGDLKASTRGQMLSAMTETAGSAGYVAIERVEGELAGKQGSFVLQHFGVMERGTQTLKISVVPDSGTGELVGLTGEFSIRITDGQHFYEFAYNLP